MDKVLIFGINGFTGNYFINYIKENGLASKYKFVISDKKIDDKLVDNLPGGIEVITSDLTRSFAVEMLIDTKPDYIVNLAGSFGKNNYPMLHAINAEVPMKMMSYIHSEELKVKKLLLIGSAAEYGFPLLMPIREYHALRPITMYGLSKLVQEVYANYYKDKGINVVVARTFNIIGQGVSPDLAIGSFILQIMNAMNGDSIKVGNLNTYRDYLDIRDVIDAYWKLLIHGKPGESYNVCSGVPFLLADILGSMIKASKKRLNVEKDESLIRKNDIENIFGDNEKLKKDTGWEMRHNILDSINDLWLTTLSGA